MADKGKGIADDDYSSAKSKYNRKRVKPNFEVSDSDDNEDYINIEDSSDDEDFIEDISSAKQGEKRKRGRPRKSSASIDADSHSASPAANKRARRKKTQLNVDSTAASDPASLATNNKGKDKLDEKKETIRTRTSPKVLYKVMKKLTPGQIKDLIDMGFHTLYDMAVEDIPGKIGLFVVENFDPEEMKIKLKLKNSEIQISPDLIHEMLGIPIGGLDINNLVRNKKQKKDSVSETWYRKFPRRNPTANDVARFINESKIEGNIFKLSILVIFSNVMGLAGKGGQSRPHQILDYITEETKIEDIDWCKYVFDCMKTSQQKWKKNNSDSYYTGPLVVLILIYIHKTKCVTDSIPHQIPAIKYWSSEKIKEREEFEFNNGGFGMLDLYENDNNDKDSYENKLHMDKIHQNVDLLERILYDINNEFKLSYSKNPDNPTLKQLKARFKNCILNEYLSGEKNMDNGERQNPVENENEDLDEEREKDEKTGFENKEDGFCNVHLSDEDLGNNDSGEEREKNESTGFEKKNVDDDYDSIEKDENDNEGSDDDHLGFEKKNENEEIPETQEDKEKVDDIKAKQDQELHRMQKRKETENEIQRRQKQRVEEIRESQKKIEENINLKEEYRSEVIQRLTKLEKRNHNLRALLANLDMYVGPSDDEIKKGYKDALIRYHPDRAPKDDMYKQVEAEEMFKLIQRMKEKK